MYNENPLQKIGDDYYVYGTQINPAGGTKVKFPNGNEYVVIEANEDELTFAPPLGNGWDKNFEDTVSFKDLGEKYSSYTNTKKYTEKKDPNIPGMSGAAVERGEDRYYRVYGQKVDLNKEDIVKFPNGEEYAIKEIKKGKITYAPVSRNWLGVAEVHNDEVMTSTYEDFEQKYYPVNKDAKGNVTIFGEVAHVGDVVHDANGKTYIVEGINGDNVRLTEATINGGKTNIGKTFELSPNGMVDDTDSNGKTDTSKKDEKSEDGTDASAGEKPADGTDKGAGEKPADGTDKGAGEKPADGTDKGAGEKPADGTDKGTGENPADGTDASAGENPADGTDASAGENPADGTDTSAGENPADGTDTSAEENPAEDANVIGAAGDSAKEKKVSLDPVNDEYSSRADDYKKIGKLEKDYYHGYGAQDVGDVGDQDKAIKDFDAEFYDERVQKKFNEFNGGSPTIHEGEGISHHHHQTMVDNYEYNGKQVTYLPGQLIELAGDPTKLSDVTPFRELYENNMDKNVIGSVPKNGEKWSKIEYAAALASSGKYSMQDVLGTANALGAENFVQYKGPYFEGTQFAATRSLIDKTGKSAEKMQKELEDDVNELIDGWKEIHELLEGMSGEAKNAHDLYTVQCIQGKFEVALGNINERLKPACAAITLLYTTSNRANISGIENVTLPSPQPDSLSFVPEMDKDEPLLKQLELGEQELNNYLGVGAENKDPNLKKLVEEDIPEKQKLISNLKGDLARLGGRPKTEEGTDVAGNKIPGSNKNDYEQRLWDENHTRKQRQITAAEDDLKKLLTQKDELDKLIEKYREELNKVFEYCLILFDFINKYKTYRQTYRKYVLPGGKYDSGETNIYKLITEGNINDLVKNHDDIIHGFEDFEKMPQITNKSDYNPGDVVLYDDAHGYIYVVKGYDHLTGQLKIACYDKSGNQVGSEITVWDQREITPIRGIRDIDGWHEYDDIPDTFTDPPKKPDSKPDPKPNPNPNTTPHTMPSTVPTSIPNTIPATVPKSVPDSTPVTPSIPIDTIPDSRPRGEDTIPPIPTIPSNPSTPHTGLDAIYGTGETKQSAAGLGALAGLAAGAAGLGLTGLLGDKDEEEEKEEEESTIQMTEEETPLEKENSEEKQENNTETDSSNPEFF